ncbi:MAG: MOFRL family protein, partial [Anaerolineae bacterium]
GRSQELALAAALSIGDAGRSVGLLSFGTDGIDGPTDAAGAWVDDTTVARAQALGLDPLAALANNDAYPFFAALGDLIITGPTGTNVNDVVLILVGDMPNV